MNELAPEVRVALAVLVLAAGFFDLKLRRIPNWVNVAGALAGLALHTMRYGFPGLWFSVKGLLLGFGIYLVLFTIHAMGGGDVKLQGAVGALAGPWNWFVLFLVTSILGGIFAVLFMVTKGRVKKTLWNVGYLIKELMSFRAPYLTRDELDVQSGKGASLPHGTVIAIATLLWMWYNWGFGAHWLT